MTKIFIKKADTNILKELNSIGFDSSYIGVAKNKYKGEAYKIFNLKPYEANILKQLCLSLGFDCAVSRDTVTCKCETTDALIFATDAQLQKLVNKLQVQPFALKQLASEIKNQINSKIEPLTVRNTVFNWSKTYIMGVLNVTPDSFSDGGKYVDVENAFLHCKQMIQDGADIIDIGGESTRPNANYVSAEDEINRVIPIIKLIRQNGIEIPISIDTRNFETARAAIEAGADIINDVSGLDYDKTLQEFSISNNIPTIIMHSDKVPAVSCNYTDADIVDNVYLNLLEKVNYLLESGMDKKNIIVDVGIGFGKNSDSNFELLRRFEEFNSLGCATLLGISRKSFMKNEFSPIDNDFDVITALYSSIVKGVNIHRVHNVKLVKQYLDYASKII